MSKYKNDRRLTFCQTHKRGLKKRGLDKEENRQ